MVQLAYIILCKSDEDNGDDHDVNVEDDDVNDGGGD